MTLTLPVSIPVVKNPDGTRATTRSGEKLNKIQYGLQMVEIDKIGQYCEYSLQGHTPGQGKLGTETLIILLSR